MSLNFTVQPGKIFAEGEKPTTAKLNQLGVPVIAAEGVIGPADMGPGDYAATLGAGAYWYADATLTGVNYAATFSPEVTSYTDGLMVAFKANAANPALPTLDAGAGAKPLYQYGGRTRVEAGDILAGTLVEARYNSTLVTDGAWEVTSLIGPRPARAPFQPASAYLGGEQGLVPAPPASATRKYLRDDGQWMDAVAAAVVATNGAVQEIFKQQMFS